MLQVEYHPRMIEGNIYMTMMHAGCGKTIDITSKLRYIRQFKELVFPTLVDEKTNTVKSISSIFFNFKTIYADDDIVHMFFGKNESEFDGLYEVRTVNPSIEDTEDIFIPEEESFDDFIHNNFGKMMDEFYDGESLMVIPNITAMVNYMLYKYYYNGNLNEMRADGGPLYGVLKRFSQYLPADINMLNWNVDKVLLEELTKFCEEKNVLAIGYFQLPKK